MDNSIGNKKTMGDAKPPPDDRSMGGAPTMRPGQSGPAGRRFAAGDLILGRYRVTDELGQGGMGVVYRCLDEVAGADVALKALPPEVAHNSGEMEEVRANFRLVSKLHHPNIANANTLERDAESGDTYLIMECVDGYDVRQWVRRRRDEGRPLTLDEVTIIAYRIAEALDYAHEQGVIHRDIKPSNVRVNFEGEVKVLDFGLAAQLQMSLSRVSQAYHGTSGTGPYMAPEQWQGRRQGAASDQYALAATVYELLGGSPPFENHDTAILREAVLKDAPLPLEDVPAHVNAALLRALSKDPAQRFASCGEFVKALAEKVPVSRESGVMGREAEVGGRRSEVGSRRSAVGGRKWAWAAVAVAVLALLSIESLKLLQSRRDAERLAAELTAKLDAAQRENSEAEQRRLEAEKVKDKADAEAARLAKEKADAEAARLVKEKSDADTAASATKIMGPIEGQAWTSPMVGMEFVWIPALKIWVGKYEVTNGEYRKQMPDHDSKDYQGQSLNGDRQPVVYVNFDDAKAFGEWLTERDKDRLSGTRYRVISEQEWQAATQCGDGREYPWGNGIPPRWGNYSDSASPLPGKIAGYTDGFAVTCPVEKSGANEWGLYGLGGNAWECCASDASGSAFGAWRGASLKDFSSDYLRCAYRHGFRGSYRYYYGGFRLALVRDDKTQSNSPMSLAVASELNLKGEQPITETQLPSVSAEPKVGDVETVDLGGGVKLELVWCPAGSFMMGSPDSEADRQNNETQHLVTLTKGFWIGKTEVTQRQWETVTGTNPSHFVGADMPVETVSWDDCQEFVRKLNAKAGGGRFRLPTEAEWECACRAGTSGPYAGTLGDLGWYGDNGGRATHDAGQKRANAWGVYDMHGNVWEWCQDWRGDYPADSLTDPAGPSSGVYRVNRGGSWSFSARNCRSAYRSGNEPGDRIIYLGVRLARDATIPESFPTAVKTVPQVETVKLEKIKGPAQGEAWASPATGMEFVWVPSLKLWVGKYEVTNAEYCKKEPRHDSKEYAGQSLNGDRQPVVQVNFNDAKAYATWLTEMDKERLGGMRYRVPYEAEWQVFAQCGDEREYPWGNAMPPKYGNYSGEETKKSHVGNFVVGYHDGYPVSCPVEKSGVNEWGLYGVGGNVWECCASDMSGSASGVWRGASWYDSHPAYLHCVFRLDLGESGFYDRGFRLLMSR